MGQDTTSTFPKKKILTLFRKPNSYINKEIQVNGWVKTLRKQSQFSFLEINDGSHLTNLQVILNADMDQYESLIETLSVGSSVTIKGLLKESPAKGQAVELEAYIVKQLGTSPSSYPLQKKRHTLEYLRTIAHLRPRTNTMGAMLRIRNRLAYATHNFFQGRDFLYVHTPIITPSDCEGHGEMFQITSLNMNKLPLNKVSKKVDHSKDFFSQQAYLTVSGQLNAEAAALAMSDVYTFGPTFRAENSHTARHLAEFWMIEPEIAFADLEDDMDLAEDFLRYLLKDVLENCVTDLQFFEKFYEKELFKKLEKVINSKAVRISYDKALKILIDSSVTFEFPVEDGLDLQSEHERYLTEKHFNSPVIVYNYPKTIKPFYMKANSDNKTVAAMDMLVPGIGEIIGGSQREDDFDAMVNVMKQQNLDYKTYEWYLDLRKYGSAPHAGFGLGFERLIQYVTGLSNIKDTTLFPRTPGNLQI